jgi:amino acid transporter
VTSPSLQRRLGLGDAVFIGLGSMVGAGVFAVWAPAADAAGTGILIGLAIAAVVAFGNATSSARRTRRRAGRTRTDARNSARGGGSSPGGGS